MKTSLITALSAAVLLGTLPAHDATAALDYKMHAGNDCKVFGSTAWTDLVFGAAGVTNISATPKNIICPIVKDSESPWDGFGGANQALVGVYIKTGNNAQKSTCNVYVSDATGALLNTYTGQIGGTANSQYNPTIGFFDGNGTLFNVTHATMLCTLAPGHRLNHYWIYEQAPTG